MEPKKKIKLELETEEVNFILAKLSKAPFEEVNVLIGKILGQANTQITE